MCIIAVPCDGDGILKRFSFSKKQRLLSNSQFKTVLARRMNARDSLLTVYTAENDCEYPRLGVSVGKSCGNAVVRNRLKRLLREAFRRNQDRIPSGFDYVAMISHRLSKMMRQDAAAGVLTGPALDQVEASILSLTGAAVEKASKNVSKAVKREGNCRENGLEGP